MNEGSFTEAEILACVSQGQVLDSRGYQGRIHACCVGGRRVLVKSEVATGVRAWLSRWMLRREYQIYRRLEGIRGIPRCFGFFRGRYLALEYVDGQTMRQATIADPDTFFTEMLNIIEAIHARGVAHGDLKRKDNILVTHDSRPCLIDFGVSVFRKPGFHPFNHFRHAFSHQHDFNAWLKHKYNRAYENMSTEDATYFQSLWIERVSRRIKRAWHRLGRSNRE